jgi:hypothetical protein
MLFDIKLNNWFPKQKPHLKKRKKKKEKKEKKGKTQPICVYIH